MARHGAGNISAPCREAQHGSFGAARVHFARSNDRPEAGFVNGIPLARILSGQDFFDYPKII
jgi:hypothetical protein